MASVLNCPHQHDLAKIQQPKLSQPVHREECTQCFDNQDGDEGVDVCLVCFNGSCLGQDRHHTRTHVSRSGHSFTLNVKRTPKPKSNSRGDGDEPPAKMTKLAIVQEREEDKYEHRTTLRCWKCDPENGKEITADGSTASPLTRSRLTDGVMQSLSSARQSEVKAWEEEITACEHTLLLEQLSSGSIPTEGLAHCASCELTSNLWLCLTCGALGCGRAQYGGTGGNGHALAHFNAAQHPVCVKLGTITPEGGADVYCYACNDARLDPELTTHLAAFGINIASQKKTEKSMTELQIEQNLTFDFSLVADDGSALKPLFGAGTTGLGNLGNSCYMASVLQTLFSLHSFQERYYGRQPLGVSPNYVSETASAHWVTCSQSLPADCLECQMFKLADGLLSGRYSKPHTEQPPVDPLAHPAPEHTPWQAGLKPAGFKALVGKGHAEFATMRQQDAEEFFGHFVTVLRRFNHQASGGTPEPTETFAFALEQRLECQSCHRVRYRVDNMDALSLSIPAQEIASGEGEGGLAVGIPEKADSGSAKISYAPVTLESCLGLFLGQTGQEALEYKCEAGCGKTQAVRRTQFATFPEVLVLHAKKFQLKNWVPTKLDIPIILPDKSLVLDQYLGKGLQPGEEELPDESSSSALPQFDAEAMTQLEGFGFPTVRCQKALLATGNAGADVAMEWLFNHMEDPDIDDPIQLNTSASGASGPEPSDDQIAMLADMGFTNAQARKALLETGGDPERAVEWLFNHPDDMGETSPSTPAEASKKSRPGFTTLPAKYRLKAFISHKGPSVHSGHYVAHIRLPGLQSGDAMDIDGNGEWVLFNDEKVVLADHASVEELKKLAYMYIFERVQD
ncbi:ubiquitinyl hydrolase [Paxillus ammoniavirescens]|nr:ubiquitinyl hydrolase [Paxillus ammoniavirescens]